MNQRSETFALGSILKRIGNYDPRRFKRTFDQRLVTQKTMYLLQEFGLSFGYSFSWYLRGPYSPGLAKDAYSLGQLYQYVPDAKFQEPKNEDRFAEFQKMIDEIGKDNRLLEYVASIHFVWKANPNLDKEELFEEILSRKSKTTHELFDRAMTILEKYGLVWGEKQS